MEIGIKVCGVNKSFGHKRVLDDISFETYKGEVFGFLGPNGAGKTTLIKMALGMLSIDSGMIEIAGNSIEDNYVEAMRKVGAIVETPEFYNHLSGMDNLKIYARMRSKIDIDWIEEVVNKVGLSNRIYDQVGGYSLGMKQRLGVAQAIIHRPEVLILDEPTNGLDAAGIKNLRDLMKELAHEYNMSVIVSSHLLSEMELLCDRVGIVSKGKLISVSSLEDAVKNSISQNVIYVINVNNVADVYSLLCSNGIRTGINDDSIEVEFESDNAHVNVRRIVNMIEDNGYEVYAFSPKKNKTLEEVFMELTSEGGDQIA